MSDFNPNSADAVFARLIERMDQQDLTASATRVEFLAILGEIKDEVKKTNGRVSDFEAWRTDVKARVAVVSGAISLGIGAAVWLIERLWS